MEKTIAQQLNIKEFPFRIKDENGKEIYYENNSGYWSKREYENGKELYYEDSDGVWLKREYENGEEVYYKDSDGVVIDNRPKQRPCVGKKITIDGIEYELK